MNKILNKLSKSALPVLSACAVAAALLSGCSSNAQQTENAQNLYIFNWAEYIDPEVLTMFEKETGIHISYDEFETNENMYPVVEAGAIAYDLVCPSDYMIQKMLENNLLAEINFDHIPNYANIDEVQLASAREFDPENKYSVPYCWGTVGILYNTTMVEEAPDSWAVLWDEQYKDNILMQDSVRDAFGVTLKYLGYSLNTTDEAELNEAKELLISQRPLVQAYVVDQVRDKMIGGEAALGVIYSGEVLYCQESNEELAYVVPKEGSNVWLDCWVIPKNAQNKENAEAFINFLCRPEIAVKNFEYITYTTPNKAAKELLDEEYQNNPAVFPDEAILSNCETFHYLGEEAEELYNLLWKEVRSN